MDNDKKDYSTTVLEHPEIRIFPKVLKSLCDKMGQFYINYADAVLYIDAVVEASRTVRYNIDMKKSVIGLGRKTVIDDSCYIETYKTQIRDKNIPLSLNQFICLDITRIEAIQETINKVKETSTLNEYLTANKMTSVPNDTKI